MASKRELIYKLLTDLFLADTDAEFFLSFFAVVNSYFFAMPILLVLGFSFMKTTNVYST